MFKIVLILCIVSCGFGQKAGIGTCPDVDTVTDFDAKKFAGTWYVQYETDSLIGLGIHCETHDFTANADGTITDNASATGFLLNPKWQQTLNRTDSVNRAKWSSTVSFIPIATPYWVLATDYTSYAIVWSCSDISFLNAQFIWVFTRERHASDDLLSKTRLMIEKNNLDVASLRRDSQSNCSN